MEHNDFLFLEMTRYLSQEKYLLTCILLLYQCSSLPSFPDLRGVLVRLAYKSTFNEHEQKRAKRASTRSRSDRASDEEKKI